MADAARKRGKRKPSKRKPKPRTAARAKPQARRARRAGQKTVKRKSVRRANAKKAKKKRVMRAPRAREESWPMIFAALIALITGLVAAWQFGGAGTAAASVPTPTVAEILLLNDYGCGIGRVAETWMMAAHPNLVPATW